MRSTLFLRCGIGGLLGGLLLIGSPELHMFRQGLGCLALGGISLVLWFYGIPRAYSPGNRKVVKGPTFEPIAPGEPDLSPSTTRLIENARLVRDRQKRAED